MSSNENNNDVNAVILNLSKNSKSQSSISKDSIVNTFGNFNSPNSEGLDSDDNSNAGPQLGDFGQDSKDGELEMQSDNGFDKAPAPEDSDENDSSKDQDDDYDDYDDYDYGSETLETPEEKPAEDLESKPEELNEIAPEEKPVEDLESKPSDENESMAQELPKQNEKNDANEHRDENGHDAYLDSNELVEKKEGAPDNEVSEEERKVSNSPGKSMFRSIFSSKEKVDQGYEGVHESKKDNIISGLKDKLFWLVLSSSVYVMVAAVMMVTPLWSINEKISNRMAQDGINVQFHNAAKLDLFLMRVKMQSVEINLNTESPSGEIDNAVIKIKDFYKPFFSNSINIGSVIAKFSSNTHFHNIGSLLVQKIDLLSRKNFKAFIGNAYIYFGLAGAESMDIESIENSMITPRDYDLFTNLTAFHLFGSSIKRTEKNFEVMSKANVGNSIFNFFWDISDKQKKVQVKAPGFLFTLDSGVNDIDESYGSYYLETANGNIVKDFMGLSSNKPVGFTLSNASVKSVGKIVYNGDLFNMEGDLFLDGQPGKINVYNNEKNVGNVNINIDFDNIFLRKKKSEDINYTVKSLGLIISESSKNLGYTANFKVNNFQFEKVKISDIDVKYIDEAGKVDLVNSFVKLKLLGIDFATLPNEKKVESIEDINTLINDSKVELENSELKFAFTNGNISNLLEGLKGTSFEKYINKDMINDQGDLFQGSGIIFFHRDSSSFGIDKVKVSNSNSNWFIDSFVKVKSQVHNLHRSYSYNASVIFKDFPYFNLNVIAADEVLAFLKQQKYFSINNTTDSLLNFEVELSEGRNSDGAFLSIVRGSSASNVKSLLSLNTPDVDVTFENIATRQATLQNLETEVKFGKVNLEKAKQAFDFHYSLGSVEPIKDLMEILGRNVSIMKVDIDQLSFINSSGDRDRGSVRAKIANDSEQFSLNSNLNCAKSGSWKVKFDIGHALQKWNSVVAFDDAKLRTFFKLFGSDFISGSGSGRLHLSGQGFEGNDYKSSLNGNVELFAKNIAIEGINIDGVYDIVTKEDLELRDINFADIIGKQSKVVFYGFYGKGEIEKGAMKAFNLGLNNKRYATTTSIVFDIVERKLLRCKGYFDIYASKRWVKNAKSAKDKFINVPIGYQFQGPIENLTRNLELKRLEDYVGLVNDIS